MNRILLLPGEINAGGRVVLDDRRAEHIRNVLKSMPGESLRIGVVNGPLGVGVIEKSGEDGVELACRFEDAVPEPPQVDLLLAVPRPKVLKRLWRSLACMGVRRIILTNAARVERVYFDTHWLDRVHREKLMLEGLETAGDTWLPQVSVHKRFRPLVEDELDGLLDTDTLRCVAEVGENPPFSEVLRQAAESHVCIAIGPEGGWVPFELELLQVHGFVPVSLGGRILSSDLACISALAQCSGVHAGIGRGKIVAT